MDHGIPQLVALFILRDRIFVIVNRGKTTPASHVLLSFTKSFELLPSEVLISFLVPAINESAVVNNTKLDWQTKFLIKVSDS